MKERFVLLTEGHYQRMMQHQKRTGEPLSHQVEAALDDFCECVIGASEQQWLKHQTAAASELIEVVTKPQEQLARINALQTFHA